MSGIEDIRKLSEAELKQDLRDESSWHYRYKDSCYIYIGGLHKKLTEGDIIIVFSQFGEPIDINLVRDSKTGESKGFCFLGYRNQKSTILAVDNMNGYKLLDKVLKVDHVLDYKAPLKKDSMGNFVEDKYEATGAEGKGIDNYFVTKSESILHKRYLKN
ncbi:RNA-binding motif protein, X-linked 2 [Babesia microti strain RI]|uniref:RNA-binding motif protein, X-linked 2 n=1 Tax=Babesia microti (strain RI) TaxID=1133968 RepID=I7J9E3_BABMR|nr:RNA-binding motif protein, X-linked 2 [Babesia microti strain RI]CCF73294.1 RNA-binding motif protein, X-linked 2 [Babesia microti strain RI]|eukprot:XP_012647903.1 RNA-binding motif protein, X-linked 2 [Babesia microti strain RI]